MADNNEVETTEVETTEEETTEVFEAEVSEVESTPIVRREGIIHSGDPEAVPHIGKDAVNELLTKFANPQVEFLTEQPDLSEECPKGLVANMKSQYSYSG